MSYQYDDQNVFAKILRGELPCKKVYESEHSLAFEDIAAITKHHILVIPKGPYVCFDHFAQAASSDEIIDYTRAIGEISRILEVAPSTGGNGYRILSNTGKDGAQMVPHLHIHFFAGEPLGSMLQKQNREQ